VSVWIGLTLHDGAWRWDDGSFAKKQYQKSDGCMSNIDQYCLFTELPKSIDELNN
jgi:hypothetical protein